MRTKQLQDCIFDVGNGWRKTGKKIKQKQTVNWTVSENKVYYLVCQTFNEKVQSRYVENMGLFGFFAAYVLG